MRTNGTELQKRHHITVWMSPRPNHGGRQASRAVRRRHNETAAFQRWVPILNYDGADGFVTCA